jgi:hypothetical protein
VRGAQARLQSELAQGVRRTPVISEERGWLRWEAFAAAGTKAAVFPFFVPILPKRNTVKSLPIQNSSTLTEKNLLNLPRQTRYFEFKR